MAEVDTARGSSLLLGAQRGNRSAQTALFNAHKDLVARQVHRMTGDATAVDDLVQEVFISAFCALPGFRGDAQLDTWLYRITTNKVRNWWDSQRRRERRERSSVAVPEPVTTPEEQAENTEHRQRLYAALGQLPDKYREAFTARAIEGMELSEASAMLGVPVSTVSYRARRAEQRLCEILELETGGTR
ncbi:MAG: sigma-70 family RNA polymerase sigma factor [Deltaproteobacteria bacterium]|nr:sigma-70 family RNA polymerase sigma factor [Deltaproteobacteria bacterium]